ncbi:MAG: MotA/TolQ/ExbB proton channel family protein [Gammaproteobacteria bacterium]|jgi:biopolymer transport protein ExbB|nr:MotA/TolQ/ExbB proton channel family protein [Gammaproteobacteria bacterium]
MDFLISPFEAVRDFMELGGTVLNFIAITIFAMWALIFERLIFFRTGLKKIGEEYRQNWAARSERKSWSARAVRDAMLSRFSLAANTWVPVVQTLVALCPLLGLMGTVTGMIEVFDVMALSGTGNARSMASGVSKATIPTMAGMVGALSGVFLVTIITRTIERNVEGLEEDLELDY